jgi:trans-aconitate methyltransferase
MKFVMKGKSHVRTPMSTSVKIISDSTGKCVDSTFYRSMIRSLLYFAASKSDIAFSVAVFAWFQSHPKESHLIKKFFKKILKYLSATTDYGVWYSKDSNLSLIGYL